MKLCERINQLCNECMEGKYVSVGVYIKIGENKYLDMDIRHGIIVRTEYCKLPAQYHEDEILEQEVVEESMSFDNYDSKIAIAFISLNDEYIARKAQEVINAAPDIEDIINETIEYMRRYAEEHDFDGLELKHTEEVLRESKTKKEALEASQIIKKYLPDAINKWRSENA